MSTYKGKDDCTDMILDFIAGGIPENPGGESRGNYNAVIGNANSTEDLSQYTIDDIYQLMDRLLAAGEPSTAVGRYQIIRVTLQHLLRGMTGVDQNTKFTPEIQDRLAVELLKRRRYGSWWRDMITDEEFAHWLSLEWASLPDPENGGKSHYDGVGPNHAGTSLDHVYAMLSNARLARQKA